MILALEIDDDATMDFFKALAWKSKIHHYTYDPMDASNYENKKLKEININLESGLVKSLQLIDKIEKLTSKLITSGKPDPEPISVQAIPLDKLNLSGEVFNTPNF
jgi:hypothetical protein